VQQVTDGDDDKPVERFSDQLGRDYRRDPTGRHSFRALVHGRWSQWVCDRPGGTVRNDANGAEDSQLRAG